MLNVNTIVENLKNSGYCKIENFLDENEIKKAREMTYGKFKGSKSLNRYFPFTYFMVLKKLLKLDFEKFKQGIDIINIMKKKPELQNIFNQVFEKKNTLQFIDAYNLNEGEKIEWHTDHMLEKTNKHRLILFIYLDSVSKRNGSMGYIKDSHLIINFLKKKIIENKIQINELKSEDPPLEGGNFSLEFFLKLINQNYDNLVDSFKNKKKIDDFIENVNSIINQKETDKFFDFMNPGDAIIFDQSGIHGGTTQLKGARSILRLHWWTEK